MSPAHKPTPKTKKTAQPIAISAKDQKRINSLLKAGKLSTPDGKSSAVLNLNDFHNYDKHSERRAASCP